MRRVALLAAIVTIALVDVPRASIQTRVARLAPASADVEQLVRDALEDRLAANDVPDLDLTRPPARLLLRREMPAARLTLSAAALPRAHRYEITLISEADLQAQADTTNASVFFLIVDRPSIDGDSATLSVGTDTVLPHQSNLVKLCCCVGLGQFRRTEGRWRFVRWGTRVCS